MTPDRHRQRVYDAEGFALGGTVFDDPQPWSRLLSLCEAVADHPWWSGLGASRPTLTPARRDSFRSSANGSTIRLAPSGCTIATLAHELSHHLVFHLRLDDPGHGPWFRATELRVIELVCGTEARSFLAQAWRDASLAVESWHWPEPPPGLGLALAPTTRG